MHQDLACPQVELIISVRPTTGNEKRRTLRKFNQDSKLGLISAESFLFSIRQKSKADFTVGNIFDQYFGRHGLPSSGSYK